MSRDELSVVLTAAIQGNAELLANAALGRRWLENSWLQAEIAARLSAAKPLRVVQRERPYPMTQERCDIWMQGDDGPEVWLELKCCVTNYVRGPTDATTNRPITQQISEIIRDIRKLKALSGAVDRRVVFLAYPLPDNYRSHSHWAGHLARLKSAGADVQEMTSSALNTNALIVVYECTV